MSKTEKEYAVRPNKTKIKREINELRDLCNDLLELSEVQINKLPLSAEFISELIELQRLSKGARQRQLRRVVSLLRKESADEVKVALLRLKQPSREQTRRLHQLEGWRDQLVEGDERLLKMLIEQNPANDQQRLRQLIRNARAEKRAEKPPKSYRALFKLLQEFELAD